MSRLQERIHKFQSKIEKHYKSLGLDKSFCPQEDFQKLPENHQQQCLDISYYIWKQAEDYLDVTALYIHYLKGNIAACPTCAGPIFMDSLTQQAHYIDINKSHYLSFDSQPGICSSKEKQRAYIKGFVDQTKIDLKLFAKCLDDNSLWYTMVSKQGIYYINTEGILRTHNILATEQMRSKTSLGEEFDFTGSTTAPKDDECWQTRKNEFLLPLTAQNEGENKWDLYTNFWLNDEDIISDRDHNVENINEKCPRLKANWDQNLIMCNIYHSKFCEVDLSTTVLNLLKKCYRKY